MAEKKEERKEIHRPKEVEYAIKLLLTSLVFGGLVAYLNISVSPGDKLFTVYTDFILLNALFIGYFIFKISQNRNWARKFFIVFALLSIPIFFSQFIPSLPAKPFHSFLQLLNISLQLVAVYFLMKKEAKEWFLLVNKKR